MINVMIADDQELIRESLKIVLEMNEDMAVTAMARSGREALELLDRMPVDIILMDIRMPELDGVLATKAVKERYPNVGIIILTTFDDDALVQASLSAGASGFLLKNTSVEEVAIALRAVVRGGMVIDPRVARAALHATTPTNNALAILTRTERVVAELVAKGLTNTEIATRLVLAEGTVKNHVSALLRKLDARDRTALALTLYKALNG